MNLKEAFRCQNKLKALMDEAESILEDKRNITEVKVTTLYSRVVPERENEVTVEAAPSEYADRIDAVAAFLLDLLHEREKLSQAIRTAKAQLPIDMDSEVSLNTRRQAAACVLRTMVDLRGSETMRPGGAVGYRFNAEGNQISYCCDVKRVTTINYDRKVIHAALSRLNRQADETSNRLDLCLVTSKVDYTVPFDVNASFAEAFETYLENAKN